MEVDIRKHIDVREQVRAGIAVLRVQGRQIWGDTRHTFDEIVIRLVVGVSDLARLVRDGKPTGTYEIQEYDRQLKKELGNVLFSTVRWIDDLGLDPMECLDLAIKAQEQFAKSGRPR